RGQAPHLHRRIGKASLPLDQSRSEADGFEDPGDIASYLSQSLHTDQGSSEIKAVWDTRYPLPATSQSLHTDQGSSEYNVSQRRKMHEVVAIPPYRSGQFRVGSIRKPCGRW